MVGYICHRFKPYKQFLSGLAETLYSTKKLLINVQQQYQTSEQLGHFTARSSAKSRFGHVTKHTRKFTRTIFQLSIFRRKIKIEN